MNTFTMHASPILLYLVRWVSITVRWYHNQFGCFIISLTCCQIEWCISIEVSHCDWGLVVKENLHSIHKSMPGSKVQCWLPTVVLCISAMLIRHIQFHFAYSQVCTSISFGLKLLLFIIVSTTVGLLLRTASLSCCFDDYKRGIWQIPHTYTRHNY